jgi:Icc-related predicted phosphoesterase
MIIDCISDLHGHYPELKGGDLLIIAGDLTARDEIGEYLYFFKWLLNQNYRKKILIAGNHDNYLVGPWPGNTKGPFREDKTFYDFDYLLDSGTEFEGLKIWGSPWTKTFEGMNPKCKAFAVDTEQELLKKFYLIPNDTDILITHSPPNGILDITSSDYHAGSSSLRGIVSEINVKIHVFGHIHECGGQIFNGIKTKFVNASLVTSNYETSPKPVRIIL